MQFDFEGEPVSATAVPFLQPLSSRERSPVGRVQWEVGPRSSERGRERPVDVAC